MSFLCTTQMTTLIVGDGGCGKTSLLRSLTRLPFDPHSPPTSSSCSYPCSSSLTFMDCGQIQDESSLHALVHQSSCVLVAFDVSDFDTFDTAKSLWVDSIRECSNVPIILVGCKADLRRQVGLGVVEDFVGEKNLVGIETSARTGSNVELLRDQVRRMMEEEGAPPPPRREEERRFGMGDEEEISRVKRAFEQPGPTTIRLNRTGSIDLSSTGLNLHVGADGVLRASSPTRMIMRNGETATIMPPMERLRSSAAALTVGFPLLVDVSMSGKFLGTISVTHSDQDPMRLAEEFIQSRGISRDRAPALARLVSSKVSAFLHGSSAASTPALAPSPTPAPSAILARPKSPGAIVARLNVPIGFGKTAVVAVREGDQASRLVEAFRKTYELKSSDPLLPDLLDRISEVLERRSSNGGGSAVLSAPYSNGSFAMNDEHLTDSQKKLLQKTLGLSSAPALAMDERKLKVATAPVDSAAPIAATPMTTPVAASLSRRTSSTSVPPTPPPPPPSRHRSPAVQAQPKSAYKVAANATSTTSMVAYLSPRISKAPSPIKSTKVPMFFMDVDLNETDTGRVEVFKGDNLGDVAREFVAKHNLPKTKAYKLQQLLEYHLKVHQNQKRRAQTAQAT